MGIDTWWSIYHRFKSPLYIALDKSIIVVPSEGWLLLVGVPTDPFTVHRSVGENSGSLIGPLGPNGVRIVEGDWSIPRLRRYSCKNIERMDVDCNYQLVNYFFNFMNSRGTFILSDVQMVDIQMFFYQLNYIKNIILYYIVLLDTKHYYKLILLTSTK